MKINVLQTNKNKCSTHTFRCTVHLTQMYFGNDSNTRLCDCESQTTERERERDKNGGPQYHNLSFSVTVITETSVLARLQSSLPSSL